MNKLFVSIEQHFVEYHNQIYTDVAFCYDYWKEYLEVFDRVCPIARVKKVDVLPEGWKRADGSDVIFVRIRDYLGFWALLKNFFGVLSDTYRATRSNDCYLFRMGHISIFCSIWLSLKRHPYAFEVVGHAGESTTMVRNVQIFGLARLIAFIGHGFTKWQAKKACCCSYTSRYLQSLYPSSFPNREWVFSSVKLDNNVFCKFYTKQRFEKKPLRIISVGRLEPEKGHSVLLDALAILKRQNCEFTARIFGPGKELERLKSKAIALNLQDIVNISGPVQWGNDLFEELDNSEIFVLPSLTEGMPRALIEAMARSLPAIGTNAGGIKELLGWDNMVQPGDVEALANKMKQCISDPARLMAMAKRNYEKAMEYRLPVMNKLKKEFWNCIKGISSNS